jgi:hypothetical protein
MWNADRGYGFIATIPAAPTCFYTLPHSKQRASIQTTSGKVTG